MQRWKGHDVMMEHKEKDAKNGVNNQFLVFETKHPYFMGKNEPLQRRKSTQPTRHCRADEAEYNKKM